MRVPSFFRIVKGLLRSQVSSLGSKLFRMKCPKTKHSAYAHGCMGDDEVSIQDPVTGPTRSIQGHKAWDGVGWILPPLPPIKIGVILRARKNMYNYIVQLIQLLQSGGSTQGIGCQTCVRPQCSSFIYCDPQELLASSFCR